MRIPNILSILSWFVGLGVSHQPSHIGRRARLVNGLALVFMITTFVALSIASLFLYFNGESIFSESSIILFLLILFILLTGLINIYSVILAGIYLCVILTIAIGAAVYVMGKEHGLIFGFIGIGALVPLIFGNEKRPLMFLLVAFVILVFCVIEWVAPKVGASVASRPEDINSVIRILAGVSVLSVVFALVFYSVQAAGRAEAALEVEYDRSEMLLRNILPDPIALRLKTEPDKVIADSYDEVTVLFADIVNFTSRATQNTPEKVVSLLNQVFSTLDSLVEKHGLEKIKTVGDAYMVVAGIPNAQDDGPAAVADFALEMMEKVERLSTELADTIELRVGIHTGQAVAGVIGTSKFAYDIWGDTVNTAARMESLGIPNQIQVTEIVKSALEDRYEFEERGIVDIKGKGPMRLYFLKCLSAIN